LHKPFKKLIMNKETIKDIFKTAEGLAVLIGFLGIILTGSKIFAIAGLGAYTVINLKGGVTKLVQVIKAAGNYIKNLFSKK